MIIVKSISGLGNQLFQYAVGRELALINNSELKIDTSFFTSQGLRSFKLGLFNIEASIATIDEVYKMTAPYVSTDFGKRVRRKLKRILPLPKTYYSEKEWWAYDEGLLKVQDNTYIDGYWQHYKYYQNIQPQILDELTIKTDLSVNIYDVLKVPSDIALVSVHIRRGDYVTDKSASMMGVLPLEYYRKALEVVSSKISNPVFCFFSDDIPWAKVAFKNDENCLFVEGMRDYEDLSLMSQCKHNIIANSSFSWWGAFLNRNTDKLVIAPKQWILDPIKNQTVALQLPDWIKV